MIGDRNRRSPIITDPAEMLREINSLHLLCKDCGGKEDADMKVSLMFGAMMSATDPVAVVALLKELGASARLGTLIEGESLLNDGTSILLWNVFRNAIKFPDCDKYELTAGNLILEGLRLAGGGILLGTVFGWVVAWVLGRIYNDFVSEVCILFVGAYMLFIISEANQVKVSGVLAVVFFGLYMAHKGKMRISATSEHAMHSFWEIIGYLANTMIFLISGIIIAEKAWLSGTKERNGINVGDLWKVAVLYIIIHVARGVVITVFFPLVKRLGYGLTWRDAIVLWYGGLRGAVGLALGLIIENDKERFYWKTRDTIMIYTAAMAMATLCINGTTTGLVVKALGLLKTSSEQDVQYEEACCHIYKVDAQHVDKLQVNKYMMGTDWNLVWSYIPVPVKKVFDLRSQKNQLPHHQKELPLSLRHRWHKYNNAFAKTESRDGAAPERLMEADDSVVDVNSEQFRVEARHRFINEVRAALWHQFEEGLVQAIVLPRLLEAESEQLDIEEDIKLNEWVELEPFVRLPWLTRYVDHPLLGKLMSRYMRSHVMFACGMLTSFIEAHEHVVHHRQHIAEAAEEQAETEEGEQAVDPESVAFLLGESKSQIKLCQDALHKYDKMFPALMRSFQTRRAVSSVLAMQRETVEHMLTQGRIEKKEHDNLINANETSTRKIHTNPPTGSMASMEETMLEVPFFDAIHKKDKEVFDKLSAIMSQKFLSDGEYLTQAGQIHQGFYIIARGSMKLTFPPGGQAGQESPRPNQARKGSMMPFSGSPTRSDRKQSMLPILGRKNTFTHRASLLLGLADEPPPHIEIRVGRAVSLISSLFGTASEYNAEADGLTQLMHLKAKDVLQILEPYPELTELLWRELLMMAIVLDKFGYKERHPTWRFPPFAEMDLDKCIAATNSMRMVEPNTPIQIERVGDKQELLILKWVEARDGGADARQSVYENKNATFMCLAVTAEPVVFGVGSVAFLVNNQAMADVYNNVSMTKKKSSVFSKKGSSGTALTTMPSESLMPPEQKDIEMIDKDIESGKDDVAL